jgi:uncharacterized protein (TIGR03000 family)
MRKMLLSAVLACLCGLVTADLAMACHRGWGGWGRGWGWGRGYHSGGWGGGYYYGGAWGPGYCYGGYAGGYAGGVWVVPSGGSYLAAASAPATLVVNLPADAVLLVDGQKTESVSAERVFQTPALPIGQDFHYVLEARVVRDGKAEVIQRRVTVRGGEQASVRLEVPGAAVAAR